MPRTQSARWRLHRAVFFVAYCMLRAGTGNADLSLRERGRSRSTMTEITALLFDLFIVFLAAKLAAELFERIHQPPVIGELLAGVLIGPFALGLIGTPDAGLVAAFHGDEAAAEESIKLVYHLVAE